MSSTSNTNKFSGQSYYLNASFKQCNISGTSMAAPQVAGVAALVLQLNPTFTPAQLKTSLLATAGTALYTTGLSNDYSNTRSLVGGSVKVLYANYNLVTPTPTIEFCYQYKCSAARGGYLYWTDCVTGNNASSLLNSGKTTFISSKTYPEFEKGALVRITEISSEEI